MLRRPQSQVGQEAGPGHHPSRNHYCLAVDHGAVAQPHAGEAVRGDLQGRHLAVDYADAAGGQLFRLLVVGGIV